MATPHPSPQTLAAFFRGDLPPADHAAVRDHVAACPACGATVSGSVAVDPPAASTAHPVNTHAGVVLAATLADTAPAAAPDGFFRVGQYELFEQIGKGGMGVVYRAQHVRLKKWVALKLLPENRLTDRRAVSRFEREMEVIGRLDHPNIVRATDAGCADGFHYLAMDLIDGCNLSDLVQRHGPLPAREVCELVRQAAVGLQHAHEHALVHRDVKPNNLMLSAAGVVKILDLGLARLNHPDGADISWAGQVLGTPDYMAPEQWNASKDVDIRSDVYSLGCTLHTLLTRHPPFAGDECDTPFQKMAAHLQATPTAVTAVRPDVPPGLDAVLRRALAKDRGDRYPHPAAFAAALAEFARGADLKSLAAAWATAPRADLGDRPTSEYAGDTRPVVHARAPRRRRWRLALTAIALVGVGIVALSRTNSHPDAPAPPPSQVLLTADTAANEWQDLLAVRPERLVWPAGGSQWTYDADAREVWMNVNGRAFLKLGGSEVPDFEFECTIHQSPWSGGVGVFFGDQDANGKRRAETLALPNFAQSDARSVRLILGTFWHVGDQFETNSHLYSVVVPRPYTDAHTLWAAVSRTGEVTARWDGGPVERVRAAGPAPSPAGAFGLYADTATARFSAARVRRK